MNIIYTTQLNNYLLYKKPVVNTPSRHNEGVCLHGGGRGLHPWGGMCEGGLGFDSGGLAWMGFWALPGLFLGPCPAMGLWVLGLL